MTTTKTFTAADLATAAARMRAAEKAAAEGTSWGRIAAAHKAAVTRASQNFFRIQVALQSNGGRAV